MSRNALSITPDQLLSLRMRALLLAGEDAGLGEPAPTAAARGSSGSGSDRIAAVARHMLAIQGQDWGASRWALGARALGSTDSDVTEAFDRGLIVRSWPMRGTIHVVPAEDIGWMQGLTNSRVLAGAPKRREFLGMSDAVLDRLVEVSQQALAGGATHDRDSLSNIWNEAGIEWQSNWRYHVIWWLCQNGIAVFGPTDQGSEPRLVLANDWIPSPRRISGDEALAELARRYVRGHGPVHAKDLAWWAGLPLREAKQGLALAHDAGLIMPVRLAGVAGAVGEMWVGVDAAAALDHAGGGTVTSLPINESLPSTDSRPHTEQAPAAQLLAAFDEHLLGYTDRTAQLAAEHAARVVPGRNGVFLATVTDRGRTVGTWRRATGKSGGLEFTPFPGEDLSRPALMRSLKSAVERWSTFHGSSHQSITVHQVPAP